MSWCRGQDLNLRTPLREGLKPPAFDHLATRHLCFVDVVGHMGFEPMTVRLKAGCAT